MSSLPPPNNVDMNEFMTQVMSRLSRLESALNEITRLQAALAASEAARKELESQVASLSGKSPSVPSAPAAPVSSPPSFAAVAAKAAPPAPKKKKKTPPPPARRAAATVSRLFGPQSDIPSGYQYVYYSNSTRRPIREVRRSLQGIGLNNARILDIQYPIGTVVSFLLHNDYVLEFTSTLHKYSKGGSPLVDFDPLDPVNLKDPKFAALSPDLRVQKAREVENLRCLRSLSFVRRPLRVAVARSFLEKDRINKKQFDVILRDELAARSGVSSSPSPKKSADEVREAKKQRLLFLSYLLYYDEEAALSLASAVPVSPAPLASSSQHDDAQMSED